MAVTALVFDLLPLTHHAEVAVVQSQDFDRRVVLQAGGEFLDTHLHRAFTRDAENFAIRLGEFDAHRVRDTHAHGAQATGVDPTAWLVETVILRRPHLVLADVRCDVGVGALGHVVQGFDHKLWLDHGLVTTVVFQTIAATPTFDGFPPTGQGFCVWLLC